MKILYPILLICLITACKQPSVVTEKNSVITYPQKKSQTKAVRITFLTNSVVKVEASASKEFDDTKSLIEVPAPDQVSFKTTENDSVVELATSKLLVKVSKQTGEISYFKPDGSPVIHEPENEGRLFEPVSVDGVDAYSLQQQFITPKDEALYGLGQHQADEINYKGKNEELFQYNTKVSVPFIVSTKNYGILWDNYSLTRFGDSRPYDNINSLSLYNNEGKKGGLTATYIDDRNTDHVFTTRTESTIDYENLETITDFPDNFKFNRAEITWEGDMEATENGIYRFLCYYAGYTRSWIDGELQFDKWRTSWNPSVAKFNVNMKKGEKHHIKLEWIPDGGVSYIGLKVLSPVDPERQNNISFYSEMGKNIRYYVITGESIDDVISGYRKITGKAQVMPKWAMGFWQSRERYKTQDELLNTLKTFREKHIPIDNIVQDWSYWPVDQWGSHNFDLKRFPDAAGMNKAVHDMHARIMISVWPKFYINTDHFKAFDEQGWMYRQAVKDSIRDWIPPGYIGSFYDAYNPDARQLFWDQIKTKLYSKGFDAWWLDATEPDIQSNASIAYRKKLMNPTALGPSTQYFNAYALMNAKGIYEGQRSLGNNNRIFILTRSGFAGIQRYGAATWSGDIGTCWEDMKAQIPAGINFAMAGLPYWTMDIGGFSVQKRFERAKEGSEDMDEWRELNTRWFQFGAFVPLFRVHGQFPYREMFNLAPEDHPAYQSMLYYDKLRYRLMPYIYSMTGWTYLKDYTLMRGLAMDFAEDSSVYNIGDQYMFGPSLLVAPVYQYKARSRTVYLPESKGWYNLYNGKFEKGGRQIEAAAPYERMPLYVKAGSIIPFGPEIEYTGQKPADPITLFVYAGDNATFDLYEDEGTNYNYEKGAYSVITFNWNNDEGILTIGSRKGSFNGMLKERIFNVVIITEQNSVELYAMNPDIKKVTYAGEPVNVRLK
ncbi:TIM-barrel domain-containing protein [Saccharicrinis sp. FJH62]|uniref:TIM-barrel domain-containing protein n=1 Tax=Saccharicrinis sp. FJH62 TaxID=3344657 RepID=UPI0035D47B8C